MNISPAQKSFGLLIFTMSPLLRRCRGLRQSVACAPQCKPCAVSLRSSLCSRCCRSPGCGERPKLERLPADAVVLAFGDSLTFGTGAAESESYPAQLEKLIGRRVVRAGVPGEVTAQALARLPAALDEHAPRLLLLCIGGNDFLRRLGNRQAERNVREMVKLAQEPRRRRAADRHAGARLHRHAAGVLCRHRQGSSPCPTRKRSSARCCGTRASRPTRSIPNARGYRVIAERLAEQLKQSGAI